MPQQVAVFGDLSGYAQPFMAAVDRLGVDVNAGIVPPELTLVLVGDLIHKGPETDDVVAFVDHLLRTSPRQVQVLLGNHEAHHLDRGSRMAESQDHPVCNCKPETVETLRTWARTGQLGIAAAIDDGHGPGVLVTHAGLGRRAWEKLGRPITATAAAERLNTLLRTNQSSALAAGELLRHKPGFNATDAPPPGVVWAHTPKEVYATWKDRVPPFDQVHGHATAWSFNANRWDRGMAGVPWLQEITTVDKSRRQSTTTFVDLASGRQARFFCVDPGYTTNKPGLSDVGSAEITPLSFDGSVVACRQLAYMREIAAAQVREIGGLSRSLGD